MVKQDLMSRIQKSFRPSRNRFDLSCDRNFTAPCGALLPVYWRELTPNTHVNLSLNSFTRTLPMQKANFAKMSENFDVFFVPSRLLCRNIQSLLTGTPMRQVGDSNQKLSVSSYVPESSASFNNFK